MQLSGSRSLSSWKTRCGLIGSPGCMARSASIAPPALHPGLDRLAPAAVLLALEQRQQRPQRGGGVADQRRLHRVAHADQPPVDVDLHAARLPLAPAASRRTGSWSRPSAACRSRSSCRSTAWCRAARSSRSRTAGRRAAPPARSGPWPPRRRARRRPQRPRPRLPSRPGRSASPPSSPRSARRPRRAGPPSFGTGRESLIPTDEKTDPCERSGGSCSSCWTSTGTITQVTVRDESAVRTARSIRWAACSGCHARLHELPGHVLEERVEVDLLEPLGAERHALLLADDRQHRLVVELRVVEPVEELDRARARGRDAAHRARR